MPQFFISYLNMNIYLRKYYEVEHFLSRHFCTFEPKENNLKYLFSHTYHATIISAAAAASGTTTRPTLSQF